MYYFPDFNNTKHLDDLNKYQQNPLKCPDRSRKFVTKLITLKTRGPQAIMEIQTLYTDYLSEGLVFAYQHPHYKINKNQQCDWIAVL